MSENLVVKKKLFFGERITPILKKSVLIGMILVPFVYTSRTADMHYTLSWVVLSFLLTLALCLDLVRFEKNRLFIGVGLVFTSMTIFNSRDIQEVSHLILIVLFASIDYKTLLTEHGHFLGRVTQGMLLVTSTSLFVLLGIELFAEGAITHQYSYALPDIFPPRNILAAYLVLLTAIAVFLTEKMTIRIVGVVLTGVLVTFLQAKASMLALAILGLIILLKSKPIKIVVLCFLMCLLSYNSYVYYLMSSNSEEYVEHVQNTPDVFKTFNIPYNLLEGESLRERQAIWKWTFDEISFLEGKGIGQWKYDVQGNIALAKYDCHTIIRRVHNEPLKFLYENGVIGFLLLFVMFGYRNKKALFILAPFLLFSFPLERAGLILPLFLLLEVGNKTCFLDRNSELRQRFLSISIGLGLTTLVFGFHHTEKLYSGFVKDLNTIGQLTSMERKLLEIKREDFLLNSFYKYQAIYGITQNNPEKAIKFAKLAYEEMPNNYGNYRLLKELLWDLKKVRVKSQKKFECEKSKKQ